MEEFIKHSLDANESGRTIEDKKIKAEIILEEIENNRFKTKCDPGIFGIKSRLSELDFIDNTGTSCCSGHPKDGQDENGYIFY